MIVVWLTILLLIFLVSEKHLHTKRLNKIPTRILVTGTRGKSSVARLVHAGLVNNKKTVAKVTGSKAALLKPDGSEKLILRKGPANILEQLKVVKWAHREKADVLIMESMALRPELQRIESRLLTKPHITLLCNVRQDHLDVMGESETEITKNYFNNLYPSSQKIISKGLYNKLSLNFQEKLFQPAHSQKAHVLLIKKSLPYIEHDENIEIAYAACEFLGIPGNDIIKSMKNTKPDPGASSIIQTKLSDKKTTFVNLFAANDPESILKTWNFLTTKLDLKKNHNILIINTRKDRPHRTTQLAKLMEKEIQVNECFVIGTDIDLFLNSISTHSGGQPFLVIREKSVENILTKIESVLEQNTIIVGIGNFTGMAARLVEEFVSREIK